MIQNEAKLMLGICHFNKNMLIHKMLNESIYKGM